MSQVNDDKKRNAIKTNEKPESSKSMISKKIKAKDIIKAKEVTSSKEKVDVEPKTMEFIGKLDGKTKS